MIKSRLALIFTTIIAVAVSSYGKQPCRDGDTLCYRYYEEWKNQLKKWNFLSEEYFQTHIIPAEAYVGPRGTSGNEVFYIWFTVRIDWAEIPCYNQFIIKISPEEVTYTYLGLPTGKYLTENDLDLILYKGAYNSSILRMKPVEKLKYSSQEEAVKVLQDSANCDLLEFKRFSFYVPGRVPRVDGHPYLFAWATIDYEHNECLEGRVNLVTGEVEIRGEACWVN